MSLRVAKVPGSKWRLADWYVAHLPATRVYLEPYFGSGAVLFNKPRSPTEVVNDTKLYDNMLLGAGWAVAEAAAMGEGGAKRVECAYLNPSAVRARSQQLHLGVA